MYDQIVMEMQPLRRTTTPVLDRTLLGHYRTGMRQVIFLGVALWSIRSGEMTTRYRLQYWGDVKINLV